MGMWIESPDGTQQVDLTQEQINVIVPLFNQRISRKKINQACLDALAAAGLYPQFGVAMSTTQSEKGGKE